MSNYNFNRPDRKNSDNVFRAVTQSAYKAIKEEVIDFIYPKKIVDGVDIGEICSIFNWRIVSSLKYNEKRMIILQDLLRKLYDKGINPKESKFWRSEWQRIGLIGISERIETFRDIGRASAMDKLERDFGNEGKEYDDRRW